MHCYDTDAWLYQSNEYSVFQMRVMTNGACDLPSSQNIEVCHGNVPVGHVG